MVITSRKAPPFCLKVGVEEAAMWRGVSKIDAALSRRKDIDTKDSGGGVGGGELVGPDASPATKVEDTKRV